MPLSKLNTNSITSVSNTAISGTITGTQLGAGIVGQVGFFALNSAPTGWIKANGAAVSRTTYASLFSTIGTSFGVGDGSTTFNVPDLRGYFPRGWDDSAGVDSGRSFGTSQADAFQGHGHQHYVDSGIAAGFSGIGGRYADGSGLGPRTDTIRNPINLTGYGTANFSSETRPKNIALLACIKF